MLRVSKAVIPAAGLGTRFLPATKATPKEMLPVVDKPAIQYVVEEAVSRRARRRPDDHRAQQAPARGPLRPRTTSWRRPSRRRATTERLAKVRESSDLATMHYVRQGDPQGPRPRRAVRRAARRRPAVRRPARRRPHRPARPAAGPDGRGAGGARRQRHRADGGRRRSRSTCTAAPPSRPTDEGDVVRVTDLVEKPRRGGGAEQPRDHRPLRLSTRRSSRCCAKTEPGRGGEIQLTDALQRARRPRR